MGEVFLNFISVLWPILASVGFLIIAFLPKKALHESIRVSVSITPFKFLPEPHLSIMVTRIVFTVLAIFFFLLPAFRDYSRLFPQHLAVNAYFDDDGIKNTLKEFSEDDLRRLNIRDDWIDEKKKYFKIVNEALKKEGFSFQFESDRGLGHSTGQTTFMVKMVDRWGIQNYILEDAHGSLTHILVKPGSAPQELVSTFQLLDTEARFINVTVRDIYVRYRIMIVPEFKQIVRVSGEREIYHHFLTAAMEVGVFPYVYISRTLYLIRLQNGSQVPIGYAIYE